MYLERLLQINVAVLSALGALLLGMGQRSTTVPLLVALVAIGSVVLTDVTGWLPPLSRTVASLAALTAVGLSLVQGLRTPGEAVVLVAANLLVFLQVILLLQRKDVRIHRQLIMLSLAEAVVATLFSQGAWFGLLLLIYMALGLSAAVLLLMFGQWTAHRPAEGGPRQRASRRRWPLAGQQPELFGTPAGAARAGVGGELYIRLGLMGLATLSLATVVFFTLPRLGQTAWRGTTVASRRVVGFDDNVVLGSLGEIIESREEVMRVALLDAPGGAPYPVQGGLYLRGTFLTRYDRGTWSHAPWWAGELPPGPPAHRGDGTGVVQRIAVEPLSRDELFCLWPFVELHPDSRLRYDSKRQCLMRSPRMRGRRFTFELGAAGVADGEQAALVPCQEAVATEALLERPDLPRLEALASQWIDRCGLPADDRIGRARALERELRDSGRFRYSLEGPARDLALDPIEDFVSEHPVGHCEYFATALALMLRSQGIPSRVVVGYSTDEYNEVGRFFQVRQLHAHTWVEAYLEPRHLPPALIRGDDHWRWSGGAWLRLDATPGGAARPAGDGWLMGPVKRGFDWVDDLWENYVVEMDRTRQREAIYEPAVQALAGAAHRLSDPAWWRQVFEPLGRLVRFDAWGAAGRLAALGLALLVGAAGLGATAWLVWRRLRRGRRRLAGQGTGRAGRGPSAVDFYQRLEVLLARHGLIRGPAQTHREFAAAAGTRLAAAFRMPVLAAAPTVVAEAFYEVRFGRVPLDSARAEAVEQALERLGSLASARA